MSAVSDSYEKFNMHIVSALGVSFFRAMDHGSSAYTVIARGNFAFTKTHSALSTNKKKKNSICLPKINLGELNPA